MSVHTKTRRTSLPRKKLAVSRSKKVSQKKRERSIPWREAAKEEIEKYTEVGMMVRGARFKNELTQKQLADKLGVLPHHISEMEHGKRPVSKKMAHKLAEVLDINYKVFL